VTDAAKNVSGFDHIKPTLRAFLWGVIGVFAGMALTALLMRTPLVTEQSGIFGFLLGLIGWLLGSGMWEAVVLSWFGSENKWDQGQGVGRYFRFNTDHKVIGLQYLFTSVIAFLLAGLMAMALRYNLMTPELNLFPSAQAYNTFMGIHGSLMIFAVAVVAIVGGFGNYFVPLLVGADDMVFPKLNGASYWFVPAGVIAILISPLWGGFQTGWTGYAPLASTDGSGQTLYYLGVYALGLSSIFTGINVIATIIYLRAPGLTWKRLPMFAWAMLVTSLLNIIWVPVIGVDMIMGLLDRAVPTQFFNANGIPMLWQDLFWLFGHPEVYIIMLPAWGLWLEILPVMGQKTLFGRKWVLAGLIGITALSSVVWTHHMYTSTDDTRLIPFMTTTELISIPTGFMYIAALGTMWGARLRLKTPLIFVLMSIFNFLIGGLTGVFLSDVPGDWQLHNSYFVVSHFHYTILGGMVFTWLAGMYYWFPKVSGRMYNELWGKISAWAIFIFFNLTFTGMQVAGVDGMNRRVASYLPYLQNINIWISICAFLLGLSFVIPFINFTYSWAKGKRAAANVWGGKTLEWQTTSPPPHENFLEIPLVTGDFYDYGEGVANYQFSLPPSTGSDV
jgi:cytochrome c oxidase subunit 1